LIFTLAKTAEKDEDLLITQLSGALRIMFRNQKT